MGVTDNTMCVREVPHTCPPSQQDRSSAARTCCLVGLSLRRRYLEGIRFALDNDGKPKKGNNGVG